MNVPISWIREYTAAGVTDAEFAAKMTMIGQKVERFYKESDGLSGIVTAKVLSVEKHPGADRLFVCKSSAGKEELMVITAAKNVTAGDIVPLALSGAVIYGGKTIKAGDMRGITSEGMFCSVSELGLTANDFPDAPEDGIMILPPDTPVGDDIARVLNLDDAVFEFEITPNRPDCLSVTGIAREAAAACEGDFAIKEPSPSAGSGDIRDFLSVENRTRNCLRYSAAAIKNVRIRPSPQWMRERLRKCGVRPINNVVDITNYVMLEYGQPMHAFDLRNVRGGKIVVRQALEGETIVTLDKEERHLDSSVMVIADAERPSAVAGVMGGEFSGIYGDTETVIFESACFDRLSVRFTSKKLGLRTDASSRFEKGLSPHITLTALRRALELAEQLGAGEVVGGIIDEYESLPEPVKIPLDADAVNALLGTSLSAEYMAGCLRRLGFAAEGMPVTVTAPAFRGDIGCSADLAEEVARVYGYGNIPSTVMTGTASARFTERQRFERRLKELCAAAGLYETVTQSFMSEKSLDGILAPEDADVRRAVRISNPFGEETSLMRTTLLPSLLDVAARNFNARVKSAALFELAALYIPVDEEGALPREIKSLTMAGYGSLDYYRLKGVIELLGSFAGVPLRFEPMRDNGSYHPGRAARVFSGKRKLAVAGEINPKVSAGYGIRARCYAAEIDVEALFELRGKTARYKPLPRFPAIARDLALVCPKDMLSGDIERVIRTAAGEILEALSVFDVYTGDGVEKDKKSIAYSLTLRAADKTLLDADADRAVENVLAALKTSGAVLRA